MSSCSRSEIVETAVELFYKHGFHNTDFDHIVTKLKTDRATVNAHFCDKDDLILAALDYRDTQFRTMLHDEITKRGATATERLLAAFDVIKEWYEGPGFHGCMFINATVEFSNRDDPIHISAAAHKQALYDYMFELTQDTGLANAQGISQQLVLLMEGAIVTTQVTGKTDAANTARDAAELLLASSSRQE